MWCFTALLLKDGSVHAQKGDALLGFETFWFALLLDFTCGQRTATSLLSQRGALNLATKVSPTWSWLPTDSPAFWNSFNNNIDNIDVPNIPKLSTYRKLASNKTSKHLSPTSGSTAQGTLSPGGGCGFSHCISQALSRKGWKPITGAAGSLYRHVVLSLVWIPLQT